jgi:hypothetical protein
VVDRPDKSAVKGNRGHSIPNLSTITGSAASRVSNPMIKSPATEGRPHAKSLRETDRQKFTHWQSPAITICEKKKEKACHLFHDSVNGANPTRKK